MFTALFFAGLIWTVVFGGKTIMIMLAGMSLIGPIVTWYMGYVGQFLAFDGLVANLIYGAMSLQLIAIILSPLLYGPNLVRTAFSWFKSGFERAKQANN